MNELVLFVAGVIGGALNSVAGGGSFVTLPALLYVGITPVVANATSTLAVWPGSLAAATGYHRDIKTPPRTLLLLSGASVVGGLTGALLLVRTSDTSFLRVLPWLMLLASATFSVGGWLRRGSAPSTTLQSRQIGWMLLLQFVIAIYGGYFGGGMGIMMLAVMSAAGMSEIHEMNGLKSLLGVAINGIALVEFIGTRTVSWPPGLVMMTGAIIGGYAGARIAHRLDRRVVRGMVVTIGWSMTAYFFLK